MKTVFLAAVVTCAALIVACRPRAGAPADPGFATLRRPTTDELADVAARVAALAEDDASFSSLELDQANGKVVVYRVGGPSVAVTTSLESATVGTGVKLELRPALVTQGEAEALARKVESERRQLRASRVRVSSVLPGERGGAVQVSVDGDAQLAQKLLERRYPAMAGRMAVEHRSAR